MYSDFDAICESCGWKRYAGRIGGGRTSATACGSGFHESERGAQYCLDCANAKNCCKFCGADLNEEYRRLSAGRYGARKPAIVLPARPSRPFAKPAVQALQATQPLPEARLMGGRRRLPPRAVTALLAVLSLAFAYAGYWLLVLRS